MARRRGLAAAVTRALVDDARTAGVETVFLSADDENVARIYARLGFQRVGTALTAEPWPRPEIGGGLLGWRHSDSINWRAGMPTAGPAESRPGAGLSRHPAIWSQLPSGVVAHTSVSAGLQTMIASGRWMISAVIRPDRETPERFARPPGTDTPVPSGSTQRAKGLAALRGGEGELEIHPAIVTCHAATRNPATHSPRHE